MSTHSGNVAPSKPSSSTGKSHVRSSSPIYELSEDSSPTVRESLWCSGDFMLGAGMVIFQRTTWKIVICYDTQKHFHFLPRGRKDLGETIDRTALREGWEEVSWIHRFLETAPTSKTHSRRDTAGPAATEEAQKRSVPRSTWAVDPATTKLKQYVKRKRLVDPGGEYLTHWYAGIIEEDAPVVNPESSRSSRRVASSAPSSQIPEAAGVRRGVSEGVINEEANGEANGEEPYYPNDDADGALEAPVRAKDVDVKGKGKGKPKTSM
ncbi:hypothetical protein EYR40_010294 [Pleurotus pulmonarius]|nr:hypothetical protein EYR40_010294 [Pleurotus pulmonarius]